jgi:hypothetical protein
MVCFAGFVLFIFGVVITELIGRNSNFVDNEEVQLMFGSVGLSMWTLFTIMTLDDWSSQVRPVVFAVPATRLLFVFYICVTVFALFNLITGIVVEHALRNASEDEKVRAEEKRTERQRRIAGLTRTLVNLDDDRNGQISYDELVEGLASSEQLQRTIQLLDISPDDLLGLFKLLDVTDDGILSVENLVLALFKCQSPPQGADMVRIVAEQTSLQYRLKPLEESVQRIESLLVRQFGKGPASPPGGASGSSPAKKVDPLSPNSLKNFGR